MKPPLPALARAASRVDGPLTGPAPAMPAPGAAGPRSEDELVADMQAYYVQRAAYYERVYHKPERQPDLRAMESWLEAELAGRHVLELACGTGWWTVHGARRAAAWWATDTSPQTMAVARAKPDLPPCVRFQELDAYALDPLPAGTAFDAVFAGCWWSHVPLARLKPWLEKLHGRLAPGARVVMLDNSFVQTSNLPITRRDAEGNTYQLRTLDDGSSHEVLKNFPARDEAVAAIGPRAVDVRWVDYPHYWVLSYSLGDLDPHERPLSSAPASPAAHTPTPPDANPSRP